MNPVLFNFEIVTYKRGWVKIIKLIRVIRER